MLSKTKIICIGAHRERVQVMWFAKIVNVNMPRPQRLIPDVGGGVEVVLVLGQSIIYNILLSIVILTCYLESGRFYPPSLCSQKYV